MEVTRRRVPACTSMYHRLIETEFGSRCISDRGTKPLVLNVVRKAEQLLVNDSSRVKEYLPIVGLADFNKLSAKLILGADSSNDGMCEKASLTTLSKGSSE